jgi:hypothetical protein
MNVRLQYPTTFTAGIFYAGELRMNNYRVNLHLTTGVATGDEHNIALDRVKYFLHNQITSSVFVNRENLPSCQALTSAGIRITTVPEEPVDQVIGIMLYCKLNAIMEQRMSITEIELASELGDSIVYMHNDLENMGPIEDYGWWHDPEPTHVDSTVIDVDNVVPLKYNTSWKELGLAWDTEAVVDQVDGADNKVVFADFSNDDTR